MASNSLIKGHILEEGGHKLGLSSVNKQIQIETLRSREEPLGQCTIEVIEFKQIVLSF